MMKQIFGALTLALLFPYLALGFSSMPRSQTHAAEARWLEIEIQETKLEDDEWD